MPHSSWVCNNDSKYAARFEAKDPVGLLIFSTAFCWSFFFCSICSRDIFFVTALSPGVVVFVLAAPPPIGLLLFAFREQAVLCCLRILSLSK